MSVQLVKAVTPVRIDCSIAGACSEGSSYSLTGELAVTSRAGELTVLTGGSTLSSFRPVVLRFGFILCLSPSGCPPPSLVNRKLAVASCTFRTTLSFKDRVPADLLHSGVVPDASPAVAGTREYECAVSGMVAGATSPKTNAITLLAFVRATHIIVDSSFNLTEAGDLLA